MASEIKIGSYTGTGAAINIELGFKPDYVRVINVTDGDAGWTWFSTMGAGTAIGEGAALAAVATNGVTALNGAASGTREGFTVGTALSESAKAFSYIAVRNAEY